MNGTLYIVVPCFNEEDVLRETASRLREKIGELMNRGARWRKQQSRFFGRRVERQHMGTHQNAA